MVDFRKMISPRSQAQMKEVRDELNLPRSNPEMAEWLVGLARELRGTGHFSAEPIYSYDEWALFRVIPELAARLDPALVRLPEEMPQQDEKRDMLTHVATASDARLGEMVQSLISHASFGRGRSEIGDTRVDRIVDMFHIHRGQKCPLSQGAKRLAGRPDPEFDGDDREPLPGSYLLATSQRHDRVLCYSEDPAELDRGFAALRTRLAGGEIEDDEDAAWVRNMLRYRIESELKDWDALSIQNFSGTERARHELKLEAEPAPGF